MTIDILKLQKIIMKAWDDYNLTSSRLERETVSAFMAVDIYRAEMEPAPVPKKVQQTQRPKAVLSDGEKPA